MMRPNKMPVFLLCHPDYNMGSFDVCRLSATCRRPSDQGQHGLGLWVHSCYRP